MTNVLQNQDSKQVLWSYVAPKTTIIFTLHHTSQSVYMDNDKGMMMKQPHISDMMFAEERHKQQETYSEKRANISIVCETVS